MANLRDGYENVAFSMPGGAESGRKGARPIDLSHLARQTMGDRQVECEVLGMFVEQAKTVRKKVANVDVKERLFLAHALKGSARSVGAFPIAECARAIEEKPEDPAALKRLERLIDEACDFIASIDR